MDVDKDEIVSWPEFLEAKIELISFNSLMVDGYYSADNLDSERYGSITEDNDAYFFFDRDNDSYIN